MVVSVTVCCVVRTIEKQAVNSLKLLSIFNKLLRHGEVYKSFDHAAELNALSASEALSSIKRPKTVWRKILFWHVLAKLS